MKLKTFFTFAFLCAYAVSNSIAYSVYNGNDIWMNHLKCAGAMLVNQTKFSDLNENCQSEIVNKVDINGLIDMAVMSRNHRMFALDIFNQKFANKFVSIKNENGSYFLTIGIDKTVECYKKMVEINSVYLLLEHFGEYISQFGVTFFDGDDNSDLKKCIELASRYCVNTWLLSILCGKDPLSYVKNPFYNVTEVDLTSTKYETHKLNLNEIFPNIQYLRLDLQPSETNFIVDHFPKLNSLRFSFSDGDNLFRKIMEKNPQIRELVIYELSTEIVKFANDHLPNLEKLVLWYIKWNNYKDEIYFKNVKSFEIIYIDYVEEIKNITFERLEELTCNPDEFPIWTEIIERNPNLKKLTLWNYKGSVTDEHILKVLEIAKYLDEATFACQWVHVETIVKFLNEIKHIEKLYLTEVSETFIHELKTQIQEKWNLEPISEDTILIVRKK